MSWLVVYTNRHNLQMVTSHSTRDEAVEVMVDSLLASALLFWQYPFGPAKRKGDRAAAAALELLGTDGPFTYAGWQLHEVTDWEQGNI